MLQKEKTTAPELAERFETDMESLITWLMTFGDKTEVLEPREAREQIAQTARKMTEIYGE